VRYVDGHFVESYYPTIENTFSKEIRYKGQDFSTEIVDTAGKVKTSHPFTHSLNPPSLTFLTNTDADRMSTPS
jgi:GTPase SAR1 family protein